MTPELIVDLFNHALMIVLLIIAVIIVPGLCVGLVISIFQAVTQINEQTLSFIPRLFVTFIVVMLAGPWLLNLLVEYTQQLFVDIPGLIG